MSLLTCFICDRLLSEDDTREVKERGIKTLIEHSIKRNDGKDSQLKGLKNVTVHEKCRRKYTRETVEQSPSKQSTSSESTLSNLSPIFDFLHNCLFCADDASDDFLNKQHKKLLIKQGIVKQVIKDHTKISILEAARNRGDEWGKQVITHISNENIVKEKARYHDNCMKKFFNIPSGKKRCRPKDTNISEAMDYAL